MHDDHIADDLAGGLLGALLPAIGDPLGRRITKLLRREWQKNVSKSLAAAESASGLTREDLAEVLEEDARAIPLFLRVLWAAGMNGHDETLKAMGIVLGKAANAARLQDDLAFDDAEAALRAMSEFTPGHFVLLQVLAKSTTRELEERRDFDGFSREFLAQASGMSGATTERCAINLAAAGLAKPVGVFMGGDDMYKVTELGHAVVEAVERLPQDD